MFVVDTSITGAEILCLIEAPPPNLVVMLRCGMGAEISGFLLRFVVKARPREATVADILSVEDMFVLYGLSRGSRVDVI
jgi:hypothetical protein